MKILITGATGFIGKFLVEELLTRGYTDITAVVRRTSNTDFLKSKGVKTVVADIADRASFNNIPGGYDVVFHCAGHFNFMGGDKKTYNEANIRGTENICRWALEHNVKKFIYVSSVAVNSGNAEALLIEDAPYKATSVYGFSKMMAEIAAVKFRDLGLPMVIIRPCMVYGEGEPHLMRFLARLIKLRLLWVPNYGETKLHLVSVRNVAACLAHCMEDSRALGGTFNVADKEVFTTRGVTEIFSKNMNAPVPILLPYFLSRVFALLPMIGKRIRFACKDRVYSIARLENVLGFTPPYNAGSELARAAASFRGIW